MTLLPRGQKVHLALGYTDMRKGIDGLAMLVQAVLRQDPFSGGALGSKPPSAAPADMRVRLNSSFSCSTSRSSTHAMSEAHRFRRSATAPFVI
jgi:transposase